MIKLGWTKSLITKKGRSINVSRVGENADFESGLLICLPGDEDVRRARWRSGNRAQHFRGRVSLRFFEDVVANAVMTATFHLVVVLAVKSALAEFVLLAATMIGNTQRTLRIFFLKERKETATLNE